MFLTYRAQTLLGRKRMKKKSKAMLAHSTEQSDQKDMTGCNVARTVISEMHRVQEMDDENYVRVHKIKDVL